MSLQNPYAKYRETQAHTASQLRLIVMLHDGAVRFLQQAALAIAAGDHAKQAFNFNKANAILSHLWSSVLTDNGEVAENLSSIYLYIQQRMMLANVQNDASIIEEITEHLRTIRDAWDQVDRNQVPTNLKPGGQKSQMSRAA